MTETVPSSWQLVPLSDIAEVRLGRQRSPSRAVGDHMRPYLRAANVTWRGIDLANVLEMDFRPSEFETYELRPGDILLAEASGSASEVGKPAVWRGERKGVCFQNTLIRIRASNPALVPFLNWHFQRDAQTGRFAKSSRGVGIHHLGAEAMSSWEVALAPLAEQRRIVETLETQFTRLDAAIATLERVRANLRRYRAAVLADATEPNDLDADRAAVWRSATIEELASKEPRAIQSGPFGSMLRHSEFSDAGRLVIGIDNVQDGHFSQGSQNRIPEQKYRDLERYRARPMDLLITVMATIGRCCLVPENIEPAIVTKHVYRITLNRILIDPRFALLALRGCPSVRTQIVGNARGQTRLGLNGAIIRRVRIPLPPLELQRKLVERCERLLSQADDADAQAAHGLRRIARLRQSLLRLAFEGRLVPQDPCDESASILLDRIRRERAAETTAPKKKPARSLR